jgi:hypothetical protein
MHYTWRGWFLICTPLGCAWTHLASTARVWRVPVGVA